MLGLISLPYEVLQNVVDNISFYDAVNLGRTCKGLAFLHTEERICKSIVQNKIQHSMEAREAMASGGGHATALRRAAKRYQALSTASPFVVATIGFCDAYLYCKGVLCYTLDDKIRVLDLHGSAQDELVISVPDMLTQALPDIGENNRGTFHLLYYSDDIVSCIYRSLGSDPTAWLVACHLRHGAILLNHELESTEKIFVRNNSNYLYYGTHSEIGTDGYKKWVIHGFDFGTRKWLDQKVHLPDMVGSEIGSTVCFEFHDGFFYALSNQTSFEVEEIDWTSFYHCVRFPLNSPCKDLLQMTENKDMWRRQHQEGPIDDRWTSLSLDEDEGTGKLRIVEARKEWYLGSSKSQRTYYTTDIVFLESTEDEDLDFSHMSAEPGCWNTDVAYPSNSSWVPASATLSETATTNASSSSNSTVLPFATSTKFSLQCQDSDFKSFPTDDPLLRLLGIEDHPHHIRPPARLPQNTHPENEGSTQPTHTLAKCKIRTYHTSCSTFLDLVDDPLPSAWPPSTQRLRLRAGSRKLGPPLLDPDTRLLRSAPADLSVALGEIYTAPDIIYWPPAQHPGPSRGKRDEHLDAVYRLLNPPSHLGNVRGTADERSLVYVTGGEGSPKALVFLGFDPAIKLAGLRGWGGLVQKGVGEGPHVDGRARGCGKIECQILDGDWKGGSEKGKGKQRCVDVGDADRTVKIDRKGKGKADVPCRTPIQVVNGQGASVNSSVSPPGAGSAGLSRCDWSWKEKAMYQDINLGFHFGLEGQGTARSG